jgi:hypothetical protein
VGSVVWNGTLSEQLDLMAAVQHNCGCSFDGTATSLSACSSYILLREQRALDGMLWIRHLVARLRAEEGISDHPGTRCVRPLDAKAVKRHAAT